MAKAKGKASGESWWMKEDGDVFENGAWAAGGEASMRRMFRFARRAVGLRRGAGWLGAGDCASRRLRRGACVTGSGWRGVGAARREAARHAG